MKVNNLWDDLDIKKDTLVNLKKDLAEGKVPQLPYFVIGIPTVKNAIDEKIANIDKSRMATNFIIAKYGNGKTNLLKYLELFFENHKTIRTIYSTANVEQPDLGLFLLKQVQDHFTESLIEFIKAMRKDYDFQTLTNGHPNNFKSIKEYCEALFNVERSEDEIKKLIYLGTGRLYTKAEFANFELQQLSNYERKEVLILFLNILALNNTYVIFQIDEIEKIPEKSKLRLNAFFTSYRELYDMFSFIKGHYLQCCYTDANADASFISGINDAFYSRIQPHVLHLAHIEKKQDILDLVVRLNVLFELNRNALEIDKIVKELLKEKHIQNRDLLRSAVVHLKKEEIKYTLDELLKRADLGDLYYETFNELEYEGLFKSINQKFFDPLEAYLEGNYMLENGSVKSRDYQSFIDNVNNRIHYFILNENIGIDSIQHRVNELINVFEHDIIIYAPDKLELGNGVITSETNNVEIVDYDPKALFVLLNMYRDNFNIQSPLTKIITAYTNNNL